MPNENFSACENLENFLAGDIVEGMARAALFHSAGDPVLAVTWPFHDMALLLSVARLLTQRGYDVHMQKRVNADCYELIIGNLDSGKEPDKKD